jgi:hypothetical protein
VSVRSRLAGDLESQYDKVVAALEDAMESTKKAWAYCPDCRKKVQVDHPDHGARIKAVELWLEQGFGRPGAGAASVDPIAAGLEMTMEALGRLSTNELAAFWYSSMSKERQTATLRLAEELNGSTDLDLPSGFAEALERLERLARHRPA